VPGDYANALEGPSIIVQEGDPDCNLPNCLFKTVKEKPVKKKDSSPMGVRIA